MVFQAEFFSIELSPSFFKAAAFFVLDTCFALLQTLSSAVSCVVATALSSGSSWSAASAALESLALLAAALPLPLAAAARPAGLAGAFAFEDLAAGWNSRGSTMNAYHWGGK